jgi:hypothetical protein
MMTTTLQACVFDIAQIKMIRVVTVRQGQVVDDRPDDGEDNL